MAKIFIDGGHGTTGLEIGARLKMRADLEVIALPEALRKTTEARLEAHLRADLSVLCLPDEASREIVSLLDGRANKILDCSTAFRVSEDWAYGLPELGAEWRRLVETADCVSNPGCYPTNFNLAVAPAVREGLLPPEAAPRYFAVSGYSGGGKGLIAEFESKENPGFFFYALGMDHKHLPEMKKHSGLQSAPLFQPCVGNFLRGMAGCVTYEKARLPPKTDAKLLNEFYADFYAGQTFVRVSPEARNPKNARFHAERNALTNNADLAAFENDDFLEVLVTSDNLGKGAGGAATQNLNLMLGIEETAGLL